MALLLAGPVPAASAAKFGIVPGSFSARMLDAGGDPENRAGSHPDRLQIGFALEAEGTSVKDLAIEMPPGFGNDPLAVPACPRQEHEEGVECPPESQVGVVSFAGSGEPAPIYLLEPEPGQPAAFTSKSGVSLPFGMKLRSTDFGITFGAEDLAEGAAPNEVQIELWGVPAVHQQGGAAESTPFLTAPSVCGPLDFILRVRSHEEGAQWLSEDAQVGPLTGCEDLAFSPGLSLRLSNPVADSPTGVGMTLSVPRQVGTELAGAQLREASIQLPPGLTVSPGGAAGLALCADADLGLGSEAGATCPAASRVGTIELTSSALPEPLLGAVYLGEQRSGGPLRLFGVVPGPGFVFKFVTGLQPDPETGRITATIRDLPPVSIERIALSLSGGPGGLLAAPLACGPATGEAVFVPYGGGPSVTSRATVAIAAVLPGLACPGSLPFAPQLLISTSSQEAGHATALSATVRRRAGEGLPARFALTLPAGISAALGAIEACPDALAAAGNCPAASRVGSARAEVGSSSNPAIMLGSAYVAGPYRRAPFSLVLTLNAKIGPFDFGTVAFRALAQIDPRTGRVTVATDRLPSVVAGIPIRFREIVLALDRPGLVRNPTSCGPHTLDGTIESQEGTSASLSDPYRVSNCRRLGFSPRLSASLVKRGALQRHDPVGLEVSARFRRGDTALRSLVLSFPPALKLDVAGLKEICSRPDAQRGLCPPSSKVGFSRARTPLLSEPLAGSAYIVRPRGKGEPDIWVALSGGGMKLALHGTTANDHGRLLTRLGGLPDLPLSSFKMRLGGPGTGLLSFDANPCARGRAGRLDTELRLLGQSGARRVSRLAIRTGASCRSAVSR